ncbi:MAG TPA: hypothetical protein VHH73_04040, partial [Verrucomicrobiae bacterium]|nr:hypothetical protein [Verrucomicrobiae bacterium]
MTAEQLLSIRQLTEKIALELVFAEPGKDHGLLPINSLLAEIEETCATVPADHLIRQAVARARGWVDGLFDTSAVFDAPSIQRLGEWVTWMQDNAAEPGTPGTGAALPAAWNGPAQSGGVAQAPDAVKTVAEETDEALLLNLESDAELLREFTNESQEHL